MKVGGRSAVSQEDDAGMASGLELSTSNGSPRPLDLDRLLGGSGAYVLSSVGTRAGSHSRTGRLGQSGQDRPGRVGSPVPRTRAASKATPDDDIDEPRHVDSIYLAIATLRNTLWNCSMSREEFLRNLREKGDMSLESPEQGVDKTQGRGVLRSVQFAGETRQ